MYTSLATTSEALHHLLESGMTTDIGPNGLVTFFAGAQRFVSLATPEEMRTAGQQGLSLWLVSCEVPLWNIVSAVGPTHGTLNGSVEPEYALRNAQARFAIPS